MSDGTASPLVAFWIGSEGSACAGANPLRERSAMTHTETSTAQLATSMADLALGAAPLGAPATPKLVRLPAPSSPTSADRGGRFAAWEHPEPFAAEPRAAF
jgi:hypothetical protein